MLNSVSSVARELMRLLELRDLAAYDVVGAVQAVLTFWEAQDFAEAEKQLSRALEQFHQADLAITDFYNQHWLGTIPPKKGSQFHGNAAAHRTAAGSTPSYKEGA